MAVRDKHEAAAALARLASDGAGTTPPLVTLTLGSECGAGRWTRASRRSRTTRRS